MKTSVIILLLFSSILNAQERVLLHIGPDGKQEAIPLKKGERAKDVIERRERMRASFYNNTAGLIDTLKYYRDENELTTNFGFNHQDAALQWYIPQAGGGISEFWWYNYLQQGVVKKGTIRAWYMNPKIETFPASPNTKFLGTYKDADDGDGGVTPFKPASGDQWFYSNGAADSTIYSFDPMKEEAAWLKGGLQVTLDSNTWQGIKLSDFGDTFAVKLGEHFGFTISNDSKKSDIGAGEDTRMEILSVAAAGAPYHSYKYYETGRTAPTNAGWHLRGDYEWGMYVVIEYTTDDDRIRISNVPAYGTTLSLKPRMITATITGSNPGGGASGITAYVFSRNGAKYDSVLMTNVGTTYTGYTIAGKPGDTVYWYIVATSLKGNRTSTPIRAYTIFQKHRSIVFIYNNAGFSRSNANLIYTGSTLAPSYDYWSSPSDGTSELPELMGLYNTILIADGNFPSRNIYSALKARLAAATDMSPVAVFFTSQDYGCYITPSCIDTTFTTGSVEYDNFGITKLGPQDLPPANREFRIIPQADTVTNYLIRFGADSGSTLWHDPTFELGFSGYPDAMVPRPEAKAVFTDGGSNVVGVKYITPSTRVMFLGLDAGALQFRSDTSIAPGVDPKYKWVSTAAGALADAFFRSQRVTSAGEIRSDIPAGYRLEQNFPNPFNPATAIEYSIASKSNVSIAVYNVLGQKVAVLVNETKDPGTYRTEWNAAHIPSGLYFYEMRVQNYTSVKKMLLLK
jgi:hypothetical protein